MVVQGTGSSDTDLMKWLGRLSASCIIASTLSAQAVIDIGSRRELFVDRLLIDRLDGADLRAQQPVEKGPILPLDQPWEGAFSGYFTVIQEPGRFRLYYRCVPNANEDGNAAESTCYAESKDGLHWNKPDLALFEVAGTRKNNVILADRPPFSHNFSPFLDSRPDVPRAERYKSLAGTAKSGLAAFASSDGIHWTKMREEPVLPASKVTMYDSQNVAFWSDSENSYVCYYRIFKRFSAGGVRWVARTTSKDFLHWTPPVEMTFGDAPPEHLYTNQTSPYFRAPHIYVGIAARFMPGRQVLTREEAAAIRVDPKYFQDCSDAVLLSTRGGSQYQRTFLESFLRPGIGPENWVSRSNYPAWNVVQTGPAEMSFFVNKNYGQPTAHVTRYALRLDGFSSLHAGYAGGEMVTRPVVFKGKVMAINFSTSAAGGIRVELQDKDGVPLPGHTLADSREFVGDDIDRIIAWKGGSDVSKLTGQPIRIRFVLKDADVFSFQFRV
jgi:hypothetical protein